MAYRAGARRTIAPSSTSIFRIGPFYGFNRTGAPPIEGVIRNWWRQGMMGGDQGPVRLHQGFSETDFTDDLKRHRPCRCS